MAKFELPPSSENKFADKLRNAIGIGDYEKAIIQTPQFERVTGNDPWYFPETKEEFRHLEKAPKKLLLNMGLRIWEETENKVHWLYPSEWYDFIPDGLEVIDILEKKIKFKHGITDDDKRFGCLPYGFVKEK
ncbi:MAG: hypothetical protein ACOCRO_00545 [Halanaerobiales bacterium]